MIIRKVLLPLSLLLIGLMLVGCDLFKKPSFLAEKVCEPPCWQNITPGVTTKEEAMQILQNLPMVDQEKLSLHKFPYKIYDDIIYFQSTPAQWEADARIIDGIVVKLLFVEHLNSTLEDAIAEIGEPKYVINVRSFGGSSLLNMFDPEKGIAYTVDTGNLPRRTKWELGPDAPINMIQYFDPACYETLLNAEAFSLGVLDGEATLKYMKPWVGYGRFSLLYRRAPSNSAE